MAEPSKSEWCDSTFTPWRAGKRTSAANWNLPLRWNARPFSECPRCRWRGEQPKVIDRNGGHIGWSEICLSCRAWDLRPARRRVFGASLADWLDNEVPIEWLCDLLDLIRKTPNLDWLLLTKRIGNWRARLEQAAGIAGARGESGDEAMSNTWTTVFDWLHGTPPPNIWLGITVCNQDEADRDVPKLLRVPAVVRFLSIEPMLGAVDLTAIKQEVAPGFFGDCLAWYHKGHCHEQDRIQYPAINWVIAGGGSDPMHPDWPRSLRDQCAAAGLPFMFKQWGEWAPANLEAGGDLGGDLRRGVVQHLQAPGNAEGFFRKGDAYVRRVGKKAAGRLLDGVEHNGFPEAPRA